MSIYNIKPPLDRVTEKEVLEATPTERQIKYLRQLCQQLEGIGINPWENKRRPVSRAEYSKAIQTMRNKCEANGLPVKSSGASFETVYGKREG